MPNFSSSAQYHGDAAARTRARLIDQRKAALHVAAARAKAGTAQELPNQTRSEAFSPLRTGNQASKQGAARIIPGKSFQHRPESRWNQVRDSAARVKSAGCGVVRPAVMRSLLAQHVAAGTLHPAAARNFEATGYIQQGAATPAGGGGGAAVRSPDRMRTRSRLGRGVRMQAGAGLSGSLLNTASDRRDNDAFSTAPVVTELPAAAIAKLKAMGFDMDHSNVVPAGRTTTSTAMATAATLGASGQGGATYMGPAPSPMARTSAHATGQFNAGNVSGKSAFSLDASGSVGGGTRRQESGLARTTQLLASMTEEEASTRKAARTALHTTGGKDAAELAAQALDGAAMSQASTTAKRAAKAEREAEAPMPGEVARRQTAARFAATQMAARSSAQGNLRVYASGPDDPEAEANAPRDFWDAVAAVGAAPPLGASQYAGGKFEPITSAALHGRVKVTVEEKDGKRAERQTRRAQTAYMRQTIMPAMAAESGVAMADPAVRKLVAAQSQRIGTARARTAERQQRQRAMLNATRAKQATVSRDGLW